MVTHVIKYRAYDSADVRLQRGGHVMVNRGIWHQHGPVWVLQVRLQHEMVVLYHSFVPYLFYSCINMVSNLVCDVSSESISISIVRQHINLDMMIWLSESSLSSWFSEVSLIRDNQGRETVWLSKDFFDNQAQEPNNQINQYPKKSLICDLAPSVFQIPVSTWYWWRIPWVTMTIIKTGYSTPVLKFVL